MEESSEIFRRVLRLQAVVVPLPPAAQNVHAALRVADFRHVLENGRVAPENDAMTPVSTRGMFPVEIDSVQQRRFTAGQ